MLDQRLRHYCRNARCRDRLKEPVENARAAFCSEGCYTGFYRLHCLVCEEPFKRTSPTQKLCSRRKCRENLTAIQANFSRPLGVTSEAPSLTEKTQQNQKGFWASSPVEHSTGRPSAISTT